MKAQTLDQYSKAITAAFLADMAAAPSIAKAIQARQLDGRGLSDIILRDLERGVRDEKPALFPHLRAVLRTQMNVEELRAKGTLANGMSEWAELATAVVAAAGTYYTEQQKAKAAESIAKLQVKQQQAAAAEAAAEAEKQRLALATSQGAPASAAGGGGGIPSWLLPAAGIVVVGGGILYAATR